jgi:hypothetical protein
LGLDLVLLLPDPRLRPIRSLTKLHCDLQNPQIHVMHLTDQMKAVMTVIRSTNVNREDFVFFADRIVRNVVEEGLSYVPFVPVTIRTPTDADYLGLTFGAQICGVRYAHTLSSPSSNRCIRHD